MAVEISDVRPNGHLFTKVQAIEFLCFDGEPESAFWWGEFSPELLRV